MKVLILSVTAFSLFSPFAFGQVDCAGATTDAAMRTCEIVRYTGAQHELDSVLQTLSGKLNPADRRRFNTSQSTWLNFRAANAAFLSQVGGSGSMALLLKETVLADMTAARAKELKLSLKP